MYVSELERRRSVQVEMMTLIKTNSLSVSSDSPTMKEKFQFSKRRKARPSTYSTCSHIGGSDRTPRFYQRIAKLFKKKRGKTLVTDIFPTEKHGNLRHCAQMEPRPSISSDPRLPPTIRTPPISATPQSNLTDFFKFTHPACRRSRAEMLSTGSSTSANSSLQLPSHTSPKCHRLTRHDLSMESGYQSNSACSSPALSQIRHSMQQHTSPQSPIGLRKETRFRFLSQAIRSVKEKIQSFSEEKSEGGSGQTNDQEFELSQRRCLYRNQLPAFQATVDEEESSRSVSRLSGNLTCGSSVFSSSSTSLDNMHGLVDITLGDWRIKYEELGFGTMVWKGVNSSIDRGQWHGDVIIHSHQPQNDNDVQSWLADVRTLTHIRHENIVLYMGACVEPPKFAIITQPIKGESLYTHVIEGKRLSYSIKLSIIRQIADAFSYLHAKNIIHGRLSAHNIFLESKVKVSLLDYAADQLNLQYYSPEIARELETYNPYVPKNKTPEGDVYAFGTLMFYVACSKLPLLYDSAHSTLWTIATQGLALNQTNHQQQKMLTPNLSKIISDCWSTVPSLRPSFSWVCAQLGTHQRLDKSHSVSEPRKLDQIGKTFGLLAPLSNLLNVDLLDSR